MQPGVRLDHVISNHPHPPLGLQPQSALGFQPRSDRWLRMDRRAAADASRSPLPDPRLCAERVRSTKASGVQWSP